MRFWSLRNSPPGSVIFNPENDARARRRRTGAAFVLGAAIFAAVRVLLSNDYAGARGGREPAFLAGPPTESQRLDAPQQNSLRFNFSANADLAPDRQMRKETLVPSVARFQLLWASPAAGPRQRYAAPENAKFAPTPTAQKKTQRPSVARFQSGNAVCVRLCDGLSFPSSTDSGGDASCNAQCPDAPTAMYTVPAGSDRIEDAISTGRAPYSALPVALRYRTTFDNTCTCHRATAGSYSIALLHDYTLRKGDVVATPKGFVVFQGKKTLSIRRADFVALAQASSLPSDSRAALMEMERRGAGERQIGEDGFASASLSKQ
jgi:hypothetical protein